MSLLADIVNGETGWADFFFLLGAIFAFLAAFLNWGPETYRSYHPGLVSAAVGCISLGLLLL